MAAWAGFGTLVGALIVILVFIYLLRSIRQSSGDLTEVIAVVFFTTVTGHSFGIFPLIGSLTLGTPVLEWQNIIGLMAASYTVAGQLGIPKSVVTTAGGALAILFVYRGLYKSYLLYLARRGEGE